jgi:DNA-binding CsgD family transcriptional regulator
MTDDQNLPSGCARTRAAGRARRAQKAALRERAFEALASGFTPRQIAEVRKVSVKTVRREIDRALADRRLDAPERYAHLQVARLTKALRLADALIDRGDARGLAPLVKIVGELDRYHGLGRRSRTAPPAPRYEALHPPPPAPLALTHAAPPLDDAVAPAAEIAELGD